MTTMHKMTAKEMKEEPVKMMEQCEEKKKENVNWKDYDCH